MKLHNPTDEQLDAAFATEVAGYYVKEEFPGTDFPFTAWQGDRHLSHHRWASAEGPLEHITPFTRSADAVLPWLEKCGWSASQSRLGDMTYVLVVPYVPCPSFTGESKSFPRAACIALLRAHGVEVTFDQ